MSALWRIAPTNPFAVVTDVDIDGVVGTRVVATVSLGSTASVYGITRAGAEARRIAAVPALEAALEAALDVLLASGVNGAAQAIADAKRALAASRGES